MKSFLSLCLLWPALASAADWKPLFNGKNLDGWESRGDGVWTILPDGTLVGQRNPKANAPKTWPLTQAEYLRWLNVQAWLYTQAEFEEYDLSLEYWMRVAGNSGISLHDTGRAEHAITYPADVTKTPAKIAYEIQINNLYPDPHPTGSIYNVVDAKTGAQKDNQWNKLEIAVRKDLLKVTLNGVVVAEHAPVPGRATRGPIGLQLHDQYSVAMYRNLRIRVLK